MTDITISIPEALADETETLMQASILDETLTGQPLVTAWFMAWLEPLLIAQRSAGAVQTYKDSVTSAEADRSKKVASADSVRDKAVKASDAAVKVALGRAQ
jgi:hypothetical protein